MASRPMALESRAGLRDRGNMAKHTVPPAELETDEPPSAEDEEKRLRANVAAGLGPVFEIDDRVSIVTHSGGKFDGVIEDSNIAGVLLRTDEDRLFFVSMTGIEHAEIFEEDGDDGGKDAEDDEPEEDAPAAAAGEGEGAAVTPIARRAA